MRPANPQTIVIKNQFYPDGLREIDVWNYYQKNKNLILSQVAQRRVMIFLATDVNKFVVMRHFRGSDIKLTPSTFDTMITGRTVSIHSVIDNNLDDIGIVDIDINNFEKAKEAAIRVYNSMNVAPFCHNCYIKFTGKESFHIVCKFKRKMYTNMTKKIIQDYLEDQNLDYDISSRRKIGSVNLDLSSNKPSGAFITLGSLSTEGLRCAEVRPRVVLSSTRYSFKI
jgi:hypothetical protein